MLPKRYRSRVALLLGSILILLFVGLFFLPELVSTYWHLRYGDSTTFQGWSILVPPGWWAFRDHGSPIIQKMERLGEGERDSFVFVNPLTLPTNYAFDAFDYDAWKGTIVHTMLKGDYRLIAEYQTSMGGHVGYCLSFTSFQGTNQLSLHCDFPSAYISLVFKGDRRHAAVFDSIIQNAKKIQ